jgi:hypothetical protein
MKQFKTAFLHFGADKTGSTSIQLACDKYRELLEKHGVYYPGGIWHKELASCVCEIPEEEISNLVEGYTHSDWIKKRDTEYLKNLRNEIIQKRGKYLILSNENFTFLNQKAIERLRSFALEFAEDCKVVYYVREPKSFAISGMSQRVKMGFHSWNPLPISDYYGVLNLILNVFSKDKLIIRLFDKKSLYKEDVVADFLSLFNLNSEIIDLISHACSYMNTSISMEAKIIGEKIIEILSNQEIASLVFMQKFQGILESIKGQKIQLTQYQADEIAEASKIHTDYLKTEFGIVFPESKQKYNETNSTLISSETAESIAQLIIELAAPELAKWQNKEVISSEFQLRQATLKEGYDIAHGQALCFEVEFILDREIAELEAGIHIWDTQKRWAFGVNSTLQKQVIRNVSLGVYRISHYVIADLPEGVYTAGFAFAEKLSDGSVNELMWYDKLCEFRVSHPSHRVGVGYANLPATIALTQMGSFEKNLISDGSGRMVLIEIPNELKPLDTVHVEVEIYNDTDVAWKGDPFRPINLSYHWADENDVVVLFDGVRTPLPDGGVPARGSALAGMEIVVPEQEGKYKLMLTIVQEFVGWFEEMGFQPFEIDIMVK